MNTDAAYVAALIDGEVLKQEMHVRNKKGPRPALTAEAA